MVRNSRRPFAIILSFIFVTAIPGCPDSDPIEPGTEVVYAATLLPLNSSQVTGTAVIAVDENEDRFIVELSASGVASGIAHLQHIHVGGQCATAADDVNIDDWVDVAEGMTRYGEILIPLDDDLRTQSAGVFPAASSAGRLQYAHSVTLSTMLLDLRASDPDPNDAVAKLDPSAPLNLPARTIVLYGVEPSTTLPATVATLPGATPQQSLPIACGQIMLVQ